MSETTTQDRVAASLSKRKLKIGIGGLNKRREESKNEREGTPVQPVAAKPSTRPAHTTNATATIGNIKQFQQDQSTFEIHVDRIVVGDQPRREYQDKATITRLKELVATSKIVTDETGLPDLVVEEKDSDTDLIKHVIATSRSMLREGQNDPVVARYNPDTDKVHLIGGETRWWGQQINKNDVVRVTLKEIPDQVDAMFMMLSHNEDRLNLTAVDIGAWLKRIKKDTQLEPDAIAKKAKMSVKLMNKYIQLADAPERVQELIEQEVLAKRDYWNNRREVLAALDLPLPKNNSKPLDKQKVQSIKDKVETSTIAPEQETLTTPTKKELSMVSIDHRALVSFLNKVARANDVKGLRIPTEVRENNKKKEATALILEFMERIEAEL